MGDILMAIGGIILFGFCVLVILGIIIGVVVFLRGWMSLALAFLVDQLIVPIAFGNNITAETFPDIYPIYRVIFIIIVALPIVTAVWQKLLRPKPAQQADGRDSMEHKGW